DGTDAGGRIGRAKIDYDAAGEGVVDRVLVNEDEAVAGLAVVDGGIDDGGGVALVGVVGVDEGGRGAGEIGVGGEDDEIVGIGGILRQRGGEGADVAVDLELGGVVKI